MATGISPSINPMCNAYNNQCCKTKRPHFYLEKYKGIEAFIEKGGDDNIQD